MTVARVKLVHWNKEEAEERAKKLGDVAVEIVCGEASAGSLVRDLKPDFLTGFACQYQNGEYALVLVGGGHQVGFH